MLKIQPHVMMNGKSKRNNDEQLWKLDETVIIDNQIEQVRLMGDTGATISAMDADYAAKQYPKAIQKLKRGMTASTAGNQISIKDYIEVTFIDPKTKETITIEDFYLIKNLPATM